MGEMNFLYAFISAMQIYFISVTFKHIQLFKCGINLLGNFLRFHTDGLFSRYNNDKKAGFQFVFGYDSAVALTNNTLCTVANNGITQFFRNCQSDTVHTDFERMLFLQPLRCIVGKNMNGYRAHYRPFSFSIGLRIQVVFADCFEFHNTPAILLR